MTNSVKFRHCASSIPRRLYIRSVCQRENAAASTRPCSREQMLDKFFSFEVEVVDNSKQYRYIEVR